MGRVASDKSSSAGMYADIPGLDVGVVVHNRHIFKAYTQRLCGDLRQDRLRALADLSGAGD